MPRNRMKESQRCSRTPREASRCATSVIALPARRLQARPGAVARSRIDELCRRDGRPQPSVRCSAAARADIGTSPETLCAPSAHACDGGCMRGRSWSRRPADRAAQSAQARSWNSRAAMMSLLTAPQRRTIFAAANALATGAVKPAPLSPTQARHAAELAEAERVWIARGRPSCAQMAAEDEAQRAAEAHQKETDDAI